MHRAASGGFTAIELLIVLVVASLLLGFAVPAGSRFLNDVMLRGEADRIAAMLAQTRSRAMAARVSRTVKFQPAVSGTDYRVEIGGSIVGGWRLPYCVSYTWPSGSITSVTMNADGRFNTSGLIVLQNNLGAMDTVSVLSSGLVLRK